MFVQIYYLQRYVSVSDHSSVGRAEDCRVAEILRSLVRIRLVGKDWLAFSILLSPFLKMGGEKGGEGGPFFVDLLFIIILLAAYFFIGYFFEKFLISRQLYFQLMCMLRFVCFMIQQSSWFEVYWVSLLSLNGATKIGICFMTFVLGFLLQPPFDPFGIV